MTPEALPTGTVTFLFTDIEGSTRLVSELGDQYAGLLTAHSEIVRQAVEGNEGINVSSEGDALFAVFPTAAGAVRAAVVAQRELAASDWPGDVAIRVRMGLHTGDGRLGGDDYVGMDVHRAARISDAGHGGQVLVSDSVRALVQHELPTGVGLRDMGQHRLKDLPAPERLWQLEIGGLPTDFPALRTVDGRPNNLPTPATQLIGREAQLQDVSRLFGTRRLVTLTGPGGTGKTRLAIAVAHRLLADFADGAFFVSLEDSLDRPTVASEVAVVLGVREKPDRSLDEGVKQYVTERELLLVLDNFEQAISAGPLVAEMMAGAPRLRVMVTSRTPLRISGEQEYAVPPLQLPDLRDLPPVTVLSQYHAVALFIDRARSVRSDFAVTNDNAPAVAEICSRLDGLPLAIELAAARVKLLSPEQILDRLGRSLSLLTGGARDRSDRQRTLRGAIDWSYNLLDEPRQAFFARLAVFAGGWSLESAEEVCNPGGELVADTLEVLASLADESLIHAADDEGQEPRFEMLQVIREFAMEKLDAASDDQAIRRRHALHLLALAETAEPELLRADLRRWQDRLLRDEENLRTALRWSLGHGEAEIGMRLAASLWRFWHYWALIREGRGWLEGMLELPAAGEPSLARARALNALGGLVYWQGDAERAARLYDEALDIIRHHGDEHALADNLMDSAWAAAARGDGATAGHRAGEALALYRRLGDEGGVASVEAWLRTGAYLLDMGGTADDAAEAAMQSLETARRQGRVHDAAEALGSLSLVYRKSGDLARALEYGRAELRELHAMGHVGRHGAFLKLLAAIELSLGRANRAARLAAASERYVRELGGVLPEALIHAGDPLEESRRQLDDAQHARAVEEGARMSLDDAVAYAVSDESELAPARVARAS